MTKSRIVACLALAVCMQVSATATAQDMSFDLEETESAGGEKEAPKKGGKKGQAKPEAEPAPEPEGAIDAEGGAEGEGGGNLIGDLAADDPAEEKAATEAGPKLAEVSEEIYAVQQIYAIRKNRIEIAPSFGFSLNDPYVTHNTIGAGLNYWITNVLAVGANLNWYQGLESENDLNFYVRRAARLATRPTEYQFGLSLNMTYVPFYGKFSMFGRYIFQWDSYLMGGIGVMRTRPVPVVDPQIREEFDFTYKVSILNPAIGIRVFLSKWLTVYGELRAYPYLEKLENLEVGLGDDRNDPKLWVEDSSTLIFNVIASVGLTVYLPFSFDYKLPK